MKTSLKSVIVMVVLLVTGSDSFAQISSAAFDPNCHQPKIGTPGVIDTIMGNYKGQELGLGLINVGPSPENPDGPGRLMFGGLIPDGSYSAVSLGPNFDPHNMSSSIFNHFQPPNTFILGHFRSKRYLDIYAADSIGGPAYRPKIYLQDDAGNYDLNRFVTLDFRQKIRWGAGSQELPYHAFLSSDTAEDLVILYSYLTDIYHDSLFFAHFTGGESFNQPGQTIFSSDDVYFDSAHVFDHAFSPPQVCYVGDFRGENRLDCVAANNNGDLFFYRNDPPFSLERFAESMKDTLLSAEGEKRIVKGQGWGYGGLVMHTRPLHEPGMDLLLPMDSAPYNYASPQIRIFPGGPDFGSHRISIDSAYFILHGPTYYDSSSFADEGWGGLPLRDCGDMTGTGNRVLCVPGMGLAVGLYNFYVLGDAIDDKIDMYFGEDYAWGSVDTCTIDGDQLQDVAIGAPQYNPEASADDKRGTILFVHGSTQIPASRAAVKRQWVRTVVPTVRNDAGLLRIQLPDTIFSDCDLTVLDILGRTVWKTNGQIFQGGLSVAVGNLNPGAYLIRIKAGSQVFECKTVL